MMEVNHTTHQEDLDVHDANFTRLDLTWRPFAVPLFGKRRRNARSGWRMSLCDES